MRIRLLLTSAATCLLVACDGMADGTVVRTVTSSGASGTPGRHAFAVPDSTTIPEGPLGASIRRGLALVTATPESLPTVVRSSLRCTSCHLDAGTRKDVMPWVGVLARFPQYRSRSGHVISIEDRIRGCFARSLNAAPVPAYGSPELIDISAYLTWLSRGTPMGKETDGQGMRTLALAESDTAAGRIGYETQCSRCHGADGQGGPAVGAIPAAPPVWGPRSYNIGAGMARLGMLSSFLQAAMPYDAPGTLSEQQARDIAAYVNAKPRPDFPTKAEDWPHGDPPPDVAYPTRAAAAKRGPGAPQTPR
ncbi:MAG: c-type cytochrome [Gemmatimonadaceae bacterium]|nr:c-type cytochrome [Gemmatimonadaceae bacterium]